MSDMQRPTKNRSGDAGSNDADVAERLSSLMALCERAIAEKRRSGAESAALAEALAVLKARRSAVMGLPEEGAAGEDAAAGDVLKS